MSLPKHIELLALQFSFSNFKIIPKSLPVRPTETRERAYARSPGRTFDGQQIIEPTPQISLEQAVADIQAEGFVLVDAFCQERFHGKDPREQSTYVACRYQFGRAETAELFPAFVEKTPKILEDLKDLCTRSYWKTRASLNPLFRDNEEVSGGKSLDVNLEFRVERYQPNGELIKQWARDANKRKIGTEPHPIKPTATLRVVDDSIALV